MRRSLAVGLVAMAAALPGTAGAQNLADNGSFEEPNIAAFSYAIYKTIPGWTYAPRFGTTSQGIEIQDRVAGAPAAGAGDQFVELDSDGPTRIAQNVSTSPGSTYRLAYLYSARPGTHASQNHFSVAAGPASAEIQAGTGGSATSWVASSLDFVASDTFSEIAFLDMGPEESAGGVGAYLDAVSVTLVNSPPDCSAVTGAPATLWAPDHTLRTVTLSGATDPDGDPVTIAVGAVTQDEPVGDAPDAAAGDASNSVRLRAERLGAGDGRVYRIAYTATDPSGASCTGSAIVTVVHDQRGAAAVDSGASYDSMTA